ncbi:MAG: hypothetical protein ABFD65_13975 [Candidatus Polarisedimenticolia bacterium]
MTFKTFDELDREAGPAALFADYTKRETRSDKAGYQTPDAIAKAQEIAQRSVAAAAFRQDNTVASLMSRQDAGIDNADDGQFDPVAYLKENPKLAGYEDSFMGVLNRRRADAIRSQIEMEQRDRETLDASGWAGTFAQIAAGVIDLPTLIPGAVAVRGAKGGYSVARSVLMAGASAGATQAATEGFLQATQETRTAQESLVNIGAAAVLGSLLGGGVAAVLGRNEQIAMRKALDSISDINSGAKPNEFVPSQVLADRAPAGGGADVADGAFYVDPINKARTRSELAVDGAVAGQVVEKTAWFNPVLRATQRYAASARQIGANLYESTIYRAMHGQGETTGASVEAAIRTRVQASQAEALTQAELAYKEMRRGGGPRMSRDDFYAEVGRAMRNGDQSDNEFVARAAQGYRKLFDDFTKDALKLGLIDEADLDVKTAASYFSRVYNRDRLLASEPEFLDLIGRHYAERMQEAYRLEKAESDAATAVYRQRLDDLAQSGDARAKRIAEIEAAGAKLDADNARLADLVDELTAARSAVYGAEGPAREAAQKRVKDILAQGGDELAAYLKQRAGLRRRMADLTERNPDAQAARAERLDARVEQMEDQVARGLTAFTKRAKNLLNMIAADPVAKAEDAVAAVEKQIAEAQKLIDKAFERANKAAAQYADEMNPAEAFAREAARAAEQGRTAEDAIRAGTREADRVSQQINQGRRAAQQYERYTERLAALQERLAAREGGVDAARELAAGLDALLKEITEDAAQRAVRRGEFVQRVKDRAAALTPEQVKAREAATRAKLDDTEIRRNEAFYAKWGVRQALGREMNEAFDFEAAARATAKEVYDKITGKVQQRDDLPAFVTKITSGPLKDRTFMVPDQLLVGRGWLNDDVREVANRYARSMAGEIELTRRFGRADMQDQLAQIATEYAELRQAADKAGSVEELNAVLGRDKFGRRKDLAAAKLEAQKALAQDEAAAITDTKAGRDLIRGTYNAQVNNSNFGSLTRSLMHFNYIRQMGGVLLANITDFYRPAFVHGLGQYLVTLPKLLPEAFNAGSQGVKLSLQEAKLAGLVTERVTHALMAANGDIADPFLSRVTHVERFMQKATGLASRWNLVNLFTDAQQAIASTMSQHRVLEAVLGNGGRDGSFSKDGTRLLRMLGIDAGTQADIAKLFAAHGETVDGIRVANTERWLKAANETGVAEEILRAENAVRAYRTAINTDVNSIVSRRGIGDAPLFANHPLGKVLTQFSGYAMGAHSRVMVRGLQESHARLVGGLVVMASLGALTSYMAAWRGGAERWKKYTEDTAKNPALLIGEGLDRSGFFPLLFDVNNRVERVSGAVGYNYRFNPIKSSIAKAGGGDALGVTSTRASDSSAAFGAVFGPSAGLVDSVIAAGRVGADAAAGKSPPKRDVNQALAVVPYQSYYGVREMLQVLTGNSNYTRP